MPSTNNVTRMLDSQRVPYQAFELPVEKLGAIEAARILQVPTQLVFKTIVVLREKPGKALLVVLPGTHDVDLKAVAAVLGEKKVRLPTEREAEEITGLQAGGISALALINRGFQTLLDSSASQYPEIYVSGGQRGLNIRLPVKDLVRLTHSRLAAVGKPSAEIDPL